MKNNLTSSTLIYSFATGKKSTGQKQLKINVHLGCDLWLVAAGAYSGLSTSPGLDASPSQVTYLLEFPNNSPVPMYTSGWREEL